MRRILPTPLYLLLVYFLFALNSFEVTAQKTSLDSIERLLNSESREIEKIALLWQAVEISLDEAVEKTTVFTKKLMELPTIRKDSAELMKAKKLQAYAKRLLGNYVGSIREFDSCYYYYKRIKDSVELAFVANQLGSMNIFMGYNELAQNYLFEVYDIHKARGDKKNLAGATNGLAIFYSNIGQEDKAISRYEEALTMFEEINDTLGQANVHANLGLMYIEQDKFDAAEFHLKKQGKLDSLLNTQWGLGFYFDFMGYLKRKQGRLKEAYENHITALEIREKLPSTYNIAESRVNLAEILYELKRYDEAIHQAELILEVRNETQSLSHQQSAYSILSKAYEAKKNDTKALEYFKAFKQINDSILNKEMLDKITEKDAKFDRAEQENQIDLLNFENKISKEIISQKNKTILSGAIGLVLVSILCVGLYLIIQKYLKQKRVLAKALDEKDILLREIHHRVKNNLQLVSSLLTLQGRSIDNEMAIKAINEGKSRVRSMALIHQDLYQKENLTGVNAKSYLLKLCEELFTTYTISEEKIQLHLDIENLDIDVDTLVPLGLIINETISNSLKYAFPEDRKGSLHISLKEKKGLLHLKVKDNGIGYDPNKISHKSFGNRLIRALTEQLEGNLKIDSEQGTEINFTFSSYKLSKNE